MGRNWEVNHTCGTASVTGDDDAGWCGSASHQDVSCASQDKASSHFHENKELNFVFNLGLKENSLECLLADLLAGKLRVSP